jgi:tetratricopeptide (TPR) repeat protein
LRPDFFLSLEHLAKSWVADRKYAEGTQELEQFIQDSEPRAALGAYTALAMLLTTEGKLREALEALESANTQAAELGISSVEVTALLSQLPFLLAFQDWDRLAVQSSAVTAIDPLNPFPLLIHVIGLAERGRLEEAEGFTGAILSFMDTIPQGAEFRGRIEAMLERDMQFYGGNLEAAVTSAEITREQGGMDEFGNFSEVRAYLALGRYQEALDALRYAEGFNQTTDLLIRKHRTYYAARAYEGLADTTKAVEFYEGLLRENWGRAIEDIPLLADANDRLEALRAPE